MPKVIDFLKKNQEHVISGIIVLLGVLVISTFFRTQPPNPQVSSTALPEVLQEQASPSASAIVATPPTKDATVSPKKQPQRIAQARKYAPKQPVRIKKKAVKVAKRPVAVTKTAKKQAYARYSVRKGDSLWKITVNRYGRKVAWQKVYQLNRGVVGSNPHLIYPRQNLRLPSSR